MAPEADKDKPKKEASECGALIYHHDMRKRNEK